MLCYSYLRFSTQEQAKGDSQRRQRAMRDEYVARRGWTLDDSLTLADLGVSAFRGKNAATGALRAFLDAVKAGKVPKGSALLIECIDRLSRQSVMEAQDIFRELLRHGLTVVTLQPEREYSWEGINENPFLLMEIVLYQIRANEESGTKSRRVKASWEGKRRNLTSKPATSHCPSWVKMEGGKFVLIPDRAAVVRRIFDMAIAGNGNFAIAKILNGEGVPSFTGKPWHMVYINHLLRSKTTIGEYQPQTRGEANKDSRKGRQNVGPPVPNYYPRVVSDETFYRAQAAINSRKGITGRRGETVSNLFTSLLFDARDGLKMTVRDNGISKQIVSVGAVRGVKGSEILGFPYRTFELGFLGFVKELTLDTPDENGIRGRIEAEEGVLGELKARIDKVKNQLLNGVAFDSLLELLGQLETNKKATEERLERLRAEAQGRPADDLAEAQHIADLVYQAPEGEREALRDRLRSRIRQLVSEIWILVGSESRYHRRATVQVFFKKGGFRFLQFENVGKGRNRGTTFMTNKDGCDPPAIDLRAWREKGPG